MLVNRVSAVVTAEQRAKVVEGMRLIKSSLPFLVSLTKDERKKLSKIGPKRVQYVNLCLKGARNFPELMTSDINVEELVKDVDLLNELLDIWISMSSLMELIVDTMTAAGVDTSGVSSKIYSLLKLGAASNASVKTLNDEIKKFFPGSPKKPGSTASE